MAEIGVVHLVRAANGIEPFTRFLASYERSNPGPNELLILFKGFEARPEGSEGLEAYQRLLAQTAHRSLTIPDVGFDIGSYAIAAREFDYPYLCFLNSFTELLDADWLAKLYEHIRQPGIGVVGATGSWQGRVPFLPRERARLARRPWLRRMIGTVRLTCQIMFFDPFPNYHIRTNVFMMQRDLILSLRGMQTRHKRDTYRFEHWHTSLTNQLLARHLEPLIVGRDGRGYAKEDWGHSNTFWQGDQGNLLAKDNRTDEYTHGTLEIRREFWKSAWQGLAIPPVPNPAAPAPSAEEPLRQGLQVALPGTSQ
jgi:hypothetical protein